MLLKRIGTVWKNYFIGQFLVMVFVFLTSWGFGELTGLRYPLLNALAAGICENIPNIGPVVSGVISGILAMAFGSSRFDIPNWQFVVLTVIIVILIQLLQNWLISPLIIGKSMELHPLLVLVGMTVFSIIFGFWGMILAVPVMASIREVYRYYNTPGEKPEDPLQLP